MAKDEREQRVVMAVAQPLGNVGGVSTVILGMPAAAFEYIRDGKTHTFDLTKVGIPAQVVIFGGEDHASVMALMAQAGQAAASFTDASMMPDGSIRNMGIEEPTKQ